MPSREADPAPTISVVIADDHSVVRAGVRMLLEAEPGLRVVGEAVDVDQLIESVAQHRPDVLVMDVRMPGGPSLTALPRIREVSPGTRAVVLTVEADPASARAAMQAGASGYVLKEGAEADIVEAVRTAARGGSFLQPQLGARLAAHPDLSAGPTPLSGREVEVLRLIAQGYTNEEIAARLYLSLRTVEAHRARIRQKLGRATRAELVQYAVEHGLLEPTDSTA